MVGVVQFEIKKMLLRPLSLITIFILLAVNGITIFLDSGGNIVQRQDIELQRTEQSKYAGEINQEWANLIQTKLQEIRKNPDYLMSQDEKKKVQENYLQRGYTEEYVDSMDNTAFLKPELIYSLPYRVLLNAEASSEFYNNAQKFSIMQGNVYRTEFMGNKGEVLAAKAEEMYSYLATNYTAHYDYNLGWIKLISMQYLMPFIMGIFLIITLSTIFSGEYSQKTDSLLLSSKYGKSRLIHAKLIAAFLVTIGFWLIIQITNLLLVAGLFNLQGAHTFVQDWVFNNSPFPFTQLTNYLAVTFMSFIGILFFAATILLISAKTKNPFISLLVSGVVLLFPVMGDVSTIEGFLGELLPFMPTQMLIANNHFIFFKAYYVFGNALLMQYAVPMVAIMLTGLMVLIAYRTFKQRQVEN